MRERYEQDANTDLYNARDLEVLVAPEPSVVQLLYRSAY
jgi:hypothetical protein